MGRFAHFVNVCASTGMSRSDGTDHNKFYDMVEENGQLVVTYGRIDNSYVFGKSGARKVYPLSDWDKVYNTRVKHGYVDRTGDIQVADTGSGGTKTAGVSDVSSDGAIDFSDIPDRSIRDVLKRVYELARKTVSSNYNFKPASVTPQMVDAAQASIDKLLGLTSVQDFNEELVHLFGVIPRKMAKVSDYLAKSSSDFATIITNEQGLLDALRGQLPVASNEAPKKTDGAVPAAYKELGIIMEPVSAEELKLIKEKLGNSASRFKGAWRVQNLAQRNKFNKYIKDHGSRNDIRLLWHGTRSENVWNILKTGLKIRPSNAILTGAMFGNGIYFAPLAQKSIGYTSTSGSYWAKGSQNSGFLILHEVFYGTPLEVRQPGSYSGLNYAKLQKLAGHPVDCFHAFPHQGWLRNEEVIIYNTEQCSALYLVEIS